MPSDDFATGGHGCKEDHGLLDCSLSWSIRNRIHQRVLLHDGIGRRRKARTRWLTASPPTAKSSMAGQTPFSRGNRLESPRTDRNAIQKTTGIQRRFMAAGTSIMSLPMKAYVYVSLKKSVLDPQGKTIHGALKKMGYRGIDDLRQGKYFEIALDSSISREEAQAEIERIAREVLTNPVIEEFRFTLEG
jgi:phosphoribosylformylglycinamidine synthase subunit PurS